ncbi:MAG: alternative ribosome rescue aminoacyl-tRNA hydrolase ArfB [Acidimicrobiales bacterium]
MAEDPDSGDASGPALGRDRVRVGRSLSIPIEEIEWRATTSGGPGGQHANRSSTRVEVRFDVRASQSLGPRQRARLLDRLGPVVRASAGEDRSQARNRKVALDRLVSRLSEGLRQPPPRRPTAPTKGSRERRLADKRSRAEVKRNRARPATED